VKITKVALAAIRKGNKIMFCGDGGSAADSQHLAAELVSRLYKDRPALAAIGLTVDTSILTASGNDYGYERIFSRQIEALGQKGDVLIAITTSGRSRNIIEAVIEANKKLVTTIGFLGEGGRDVGALVDYQINVPSISIPKIQEAHIAIGHIFCALLEKQMFFNDDKLCKNVCS
jgi:D-sedoheptulose 7-phosphate isomerase